MTVAAAADVVEVAEAAEEAAVGVAVMSVGGEGANEDDEAKLAGAKVAECVEAAGKATEALRRLGEARDEGWEEPWEEVDIDRGQSIAGGSTSRSQSLSAHQYVRFGSQMRRVERMISKTTSEVFCSFHTRYAIASVAEREMPA